MNDDDDNMPDGRTELSGDVLIRLFQQMESNLYGLAQHKVQEADRLKSNGVTTDAAEAYITLREAKTVKECNDVVQATIKKWVEGL